MGKARIIAVDTGNAQIKTPNFTFTAGLVMHGQDAPSIPGEVIRLKGNYYSLTESRITYRQDKTEDEAYYVLALFAIAKELVKSHDERFSQDIYLAMGLPPSDLSKFKARYIEYFKRGGQPVSFTYNATPISVSVKDVFVYPQGFAALAPYFNIVQSEAQVFLIDIGGYTTDVVRMANGKPDTSFVESFPYGIIHLYNRCERELRNKLNLQIDYVLFGSLLSSRRPDPHQMNAWTLIQQIAVGYAQELVHTLEEKGVELKLSLPVFVGGGAATLKSTICGLNIRSPYFIPEIVRANAIGYLLLSQQALTHLD